MLGSYSIEALKELVLLKYKLTALSIKYWFKGYLRYETTTPQNVLSEAQVKNFLFRRDVMFRSQDIQVFVFYPSRDLANL